VEKQERFMKPQRIINFKIINFKKYLWRKSCTVLRW